jgi:class 3 adenylate cyclase/predicted ATPase
VDLRPFLPRAVLRLLAERPERPLLRPERMEGACLFADVSGFTALSEALAALGAEGGEVLTRVLNAFYAAVIAVLEPAGGDVMRFAGDAVTVFFPGEEGMGRALRAGLDLQAMMERFASVPTPAGPAELRMKIGVAAGECRLFLVGDGERRDYVFAGAPVDEAAGAEHHASAGEVVLAAAEAPPRVGRGEAVAPGLWRILDAPAPPPAQEAAPPLVPAAALHPFLPSKLVEWAQTGMLERVNEHRPVTVLFIRFGDRLDPANAEDLAVLGRFYGEALAAARRYDGTINKVDCGDKGNTLLVLFGAPVAHEDDTERALEFALELQNAARAAGLSLRAGINRARVFCGLVGSPLRREYTVMGDGVNLAARLMQAAAEGSVFVGEGVKEGRAQAYRFQDLPPMRFKGKSRALPVARLQGRSGDRMDIPFFVGRETELRRLEEALRSALPDRPFLGWIAGETGVGKSFLLHYFGDLHLGDSRHYSRCHSYTAGIAHYAAQKLVLECLQDLLAAGAFQPRDKALALLADRAPDIAEYAPLLLRTLNLAGADDAVPELEPEVRRSLLWRMMLIVLEEAARQGTVSWVVDNGEWLDPESRDFLLHAARVMETGRFRIVVASREPAPDEPGLEPVAVGLGPLSRAETEALARRLLEVETVPDEALRKVWEVSKGNPLMVQETLRLMFTAGYLARSEDAPGVLLVDETRQPEMPGSVAGFVLAQADALPAAEREALATLSVAGENVPRGLLPRLGVDPTVAERLASDGRYLRFNPLSQNYYFIKPSFQQALYESLEFTFRRETHRRAAEGLEGLVHASRPDRAHLLAWHFGEARDPRALPHLKAIAREARAGYALKEAAAAYGRIVDIGGEAGEDLQEAVLALADLLLLLGKAAEADPLLERHWTSFDGERLSPAHLARAAALRGLGAFPQAEEQARLALEAARTPRDRFLAESFRAKLLGQTGRMKEALAAMEGLLAAHRRFRNDPEYQMNRMRLAFVGSQMGKEAEALAVMRDVVRRFRTRRHIKGLYAALNNTAMLYFYADRSKLAQRHYTEALALLKRYGIWEEESLLNLLLNIGLIHLNAGEFTDARARFSEAMAYASRFDSSLKAKAHYLTALLEVQMGRYGPAYRHLSHSYEICERRGIPKNETHEIAMELFLDLAAKKPFFVTLEDYRREIQAMGLSYLEPSLRNYEAEAALVFGNPEVLVAPLKANLETCLRSNLLAEAFRSARFLLRATREAAYLDQAKECLTSNSRRVHVVEEALLEWEFRPGPGAARRLSKLLARYPYRPIERRMRLLRAARARTAKERAAHERAARELQREMTAGLPDELVPHG